MYVTEAQLRGRLRRPEMGAIVAVPAGARLSPAAADFVKQWNLVLVDERGAPQPAEAQDWDRPAHFPLSAAQGPRCTTCGREVDEKPSSLTQLNAHHYAPKTHPRIVLRGQLDSLHAFVLLAQRQAVDDGASSTAADLRTLAAYCRELLSAEYNERACAELSLPSATQEQIHAATHDPASTLGIPHLAIDESEPLLQHWLNVLRTQVRMIEITALTTFESPHHPYGAAICHGLNRLSSAFYYVALKLKRGAQT